MKKTEMKAEEYGDRGTSKVLFPGLLSVVTTVDEQDRTNAAVKSDLMWMVSNPPTIALSCNMNHHTAQNILSQKEFVFNIPGEESLGKVLKTAEDYPRGVNELEEAGLTAIPSLKVKPPRVEECVEHFECVLESYLRYGEEVVLFGRVVSASMNEDLIEKPTAERHTSARPVLVLGDYLYVPISEVKKML